MAKSVEPVKKLNALVAGAAGFIGPHVARRLLDRDNEVL